MPDASDKPAQQSAGPLRLLLRALLPALGVYAALAAVMVLVPDGNDYGRASALKGARLETLPGSRIVLIGGSNLAFGINSPLIESLTGCQVANMGMNGYLGVRFMLAEAAAGLREGDVAVIALEYDNFVKPVEGTSTDLLMVAKYSPRVLRHMTIPQILGAASRVPYVVNRKVDRLAEEAVQGTFDALFARNTSPAEVGGANDDVSIEAIESFAGFTESGDLISHLGVHWPYKREPGLDLTTLPLEPELLPLVREFSMRQKGQGVDVIFSYTPLIRYFYDQHRDAIAGFDAAVRRELAEVAQTPSPPEAFVYGTEMFFDTVYHLNREGRDQRSRRLAQDIIARKPGSDRCRGPSNIQPG